VLSFCQLASHHSTVLWNFAINIAFSALLASTKRHRVSHLSAATSSPHPNLSSPGSQATVVPILPFKPAYVWQSRTGIPSCQLNCGAYVEIVCLFRHCTYTKQILSLSSTASMVLVNQHEIMMLFPSPCRPRYVCNPMSFHQHTLPKILRSSNNLRRKPA